MPKKTPEQRLAETRERLAERYPGIVEAIASLPNGEVALKYGFSHERARQIRELLGFEPIQKHAWTREQRIEQIRALAVEGCDAITISRRLGLNRSTVWTLASQTGIELPVARPVMPTNTPEEIEAKYPGMIEMLKSGRGAIMRASKHFGLSYTHVSRLRNRLAEHGVVEKDWEAAERASKLRREEWERGRRNAS